MIVVAGPPGAGKSTAFPVSGFGIDFCNADDTAAALNRGSYIGIPPSVRRGVNTLFESFVLDHIEHRMSCAFETTLRSDITFAQVAPAKQAGFYTEMRFVVLRDFALHLERVKMRADAGGHSAPETVLRAIWESSSRNLPRAMRQMDFIHVYDNSGWGAAPTVLLQAANGEVVYLAENIPQWLSTALEQL
jgi:predicted ABC-type ATPase